ncbi:hypothetical protein TNCV_1046291 [Trichonephila clavipes]|nr:hypothetical protein TNCV_1046291 [Trichonephila clavipes]
MNVYKQLRVPVPTTGAPLITQYRDILLSSSHRQRTWICSCIQYCLQINIVSFCGGMTTIDGYDCDPENNTNRPISLSIKPVLHHTSRFLLGRGHWTSLVLIDSGLTADHYVTQIAEPVILPLLQGEPNMRSQQDNATPHVTRRMDLPSFSGQQTLFI